jgi:hypothetical protein
MSNLPQPPLNLNHDLMVSIRNFPLPPLASEPGEAFGLRLSFLALFL